MKSERKITVVDGLAVDSQGYKVIEKISWSLMKERIGKDTINQKEVEDYLYRKYNK